MGKVGESIQHFNSTARTLIAAGALVLVSAGAYKGYQLLVQPSEELRNARRDLDDAQSSLKEKDKLLAERDASIDKLNLQVSEVTAKNKLLQTENDRLATSIKLLRLKHRLARISVREQTRDEDGNLQTVFDFVEINEEGQPVGETRTLTIDGDRIYVEFLVVKFDDDYIAKADLERGTAICLIQRVFGEKQQPADGYIIDEIGTRPTSYERGFPVSEFERQIWDDFWTIANDRDRAEKLGIRAMQAEAPSLRVIEGQTYEIDIRSTGDFSFLPVKQ